MFLDCLLMVVVFATVRVAAILLGSIKVPYKEIKRRVLACDQENLTAAMVEQLLKNMPAQDELNKLAAMKDQYDELAEAEQFAIVVSTLLTYYICDPAHTAK